eukprot:218437-Hanusia_phi.AAC.1
MRPRRSDPRLIGRRCRRRVIPGPVARADRVTVTHLLNFIIKSGAGNSGTIGEVLNRTVPLVPDRTTARASLGRTTMIVVTVLGPRYCTVPPAVPSAAPSQRQQALSVDLGYLTELSAFMPQCHCSSLARRTVRCVISASLVSPHDPPFHCQHFTSQVVILHKGDNSVTAGISSRRVLSPQHCGHCSGLPMTHHDGALHTLTD